MPDFSGKCVDYPGKTDKIDVEFTNTSKRCLNDLHFYVFPTSIWVDTPDIVKVKLTLPGGRVVEHDNDDGEGGAENDMDEVNFKEIKPCIKDGEKFRLQVSFEQKFAGDEGYVLLGTVDGATVGSDPDMSAVPIPEGPSTFDVIINVLEKLGGAAGAASGFIGKVENKEELMLALRRRKKRARKTIRVGDGQG